jgi:hypothetical protein
MLENNIKTDLREMGFKGTYRIQLEQDRVQWQDFINMRIINVRISWKEAPDAQSIIMCWVVKSTGAVGRPHSGSSAWEEGDTRFLHARGTQVSGLLRRWWCELPTLLQGWNATCHISYLPLRVDIWIQITENYVSAECSRLYWGRIKW